MPAIIHGVPVRYRILVEGECAGLLEAQVHALIQNGMSFSARLASCNRAMTVQVGTEVLNAKPE
jgi:hypothetical protein